jgi:hypothetical protein
MNQNLREAVQTLVRQCGRARAILERFTEDTPVREIARQLEDMDDYSLQLERQAEQVQRLLDIDFLIEYLTSHGQK